MTAIDRYLAPASLAEALDALAAGDCTVLAGGTDLMPQSQAGRIAFRPTLLNIRRIAALRGIAESGDAIRIGALTTIAELLDSDLIAARLPVLREAADHFASGQIRNAGTIGGNLCNASPAGDTLVPLMVLGAEVELAAATGSRRLPVAAFFAGPGRTHRAPSELLATVHVPLPRPGFRARFAKFGTRPALDISTVSVGVGAVIENGVFRDVRVAFGAVGPTPLVGARTQAALEGRPADAATIAAAAQAAHDEVTPIDDVRATAWYRREMIRNLTKKVLSDVADA